MGNNPDQDRQTQYELLQSIYFGLSGNPDHAKETILSLLHNSPTNAPARDVLAALVL